MTLDARTGMQHAVAPDDFCVRVGKKRVGVPVPLAKALGNLGSVHADCHRAHPQCFECAQILFYTPQLGVTERSPIAPIEDEQHTLGSTRRPGLASKRGREELGQRQRFPVGVRQRKLGTLLTNLRGAGSGGRMPGLNKYGVTEDSKNSRAEAGKDRARDFFRDRRKVGRTRVAVPRQTIPSQARKAGNWPTERLGLWGTGKRKENS